MFARVTRRAALAALLLGPLVPGLGLGAAPLAAQYHAPRTRARPVPPPPIPSAGDAPISAEDLRRHIAVLAGDAFQGRAPATEGERLTTDYIVRELTARGVEPAGPNGGWLQPVALVERGIGQSQANWQARGRALNIPATSFLLSSGEATARVDDARIVFAGHGAIMPDRGIDQLAGADVRGAIVLIMAEGPQIEGFPSLSERIRAVAEAGAAAVISIASPEFPFAQMQSVRDVRQTSLASAPTPAVFGIASFEAASALFAAGGQNLTQALDAQPGSSFRSIALPVTGTLAVTTPVRRFTTNNVVGRIRGNGNSGQTVLLMSHWDHLGLCRPEGDADRICNGAVDNASGIATLIETAGRLTSGTRPVRDILILATTAEEMGLLGAEQFAETPIVPLNSIVAGLNVDTAAIAPAGMPVAVIGREQRLERVVARVATSMGRTLDPDREADALEQRQDGWALARRGVPVIMANGSFSDMARLGAFLQGAYHGPDDELTATTELAGAAEDADLLVAITRAFADPSILPPPQRPAN